MKDGYASCVELPGEIAEHAEGVDLLSLCCVMAELMGFEARPKKWGHSSLARESSDRRQEQKPVIFVVSCKLFLLECGNFPSAFFGLELECFANCFWANSREIENSDGRSE